MNRKTINQLNVLNQQFYKTVAESFNQSRVQPWEGWQPIPNLVNSYFNETKYINLLDVGCGNGRFADFLSQKLPDHTLNYIGIDSSSELLDYAQEKLAVHTNLSFDLLPVDILNTNQQWINSSNQFQICSLFGLLHHIPSFNLRRHVIEQAVSYLQPGGILLLSFWQFTKSAQFKRHLSTSQISDLAIDPAQLEPNDYFLDWQRSVSAIGYCPVRYCHLVDEKEIDILVENLNLKVLDSFEADSSNLYLFLQKD